MGRTLLWGIYFSYSFQIFDPAPSIPTKWSIQSANASGSRSNRPRRTWYCRMDTKNEFLEAIKQSTTSDMVQNFKRFFPNSMYQGKCIDLSIEFLISLRSQLTLDQICGLASFFLANPYGHRNGWPDLTLVRQKSIKLIEVKTTDKLRFSQIRTFLKIRAYIPDISVVRVVRN